MLQSPDPTPSRDGVSWLPVAYAGPSSSTNGSARANQGTGRCSSEVSAVYQTDSASDARLVVTTVSDWLDSLAESAMTFHRDELSTSPKAKQGQLEKLEGSLKSEVALSRSTIGVEKRSPVNKPSLAISRRADDALVVHIPVTEGMTCGARLALSIVSALVVCAMIALLTARSGKWMLYGVLLVVVTEFCFLYWAIKTPRPHQHLVITPSRFYLHKTALYDDKAIAAQENNSGTNFAPPHVSAIDYLLWKQISGNTSDLQRAEVQESYGPDGEAVHVLALQENSTQHSLGTAFSADEGARLVFEINKALFDFQNRQPVPSGMP